MRQKAYAMYMMLGAKSRKIAKLIFLETLTIGIISIALGVIIGMGLTKVVSNLLINKLSISVTHFSPLMQLLCLLQQHFF